MEPKDSGKQTTGIHIKQHDVLGVTQIFKFHYNPPGGVVVIGRSVGSMWRWLCLVPYIHVFFIGVLTSIACRQFCVMMTRKCSWLSKG